jgi:hypothetical protein
MITGWPHASLNFCPSVRPMMSEVPPGENGTTTRMGLAGYACPAASEGASRTARAMLVNSVFMEDLLILLVPDAARPADGLNDVKRV